MSKKIFGSSFVVLTVVFAACGGNSPQDECKKIGDVICAKLYECATPQAIAALGYTSQSDCQTKSYSKDNCNNPVVCSGGGVYHGDQADQCVSNYQNATCGEIAGGTVDQTPCSKVCQSQ